MGLSIFRTKKPESGTGVIKEVKDVTCDEDVTKTLQEFQIRELCFWSCVHYIAALVGRCEIRTYVNREEKREKEYWLWNVEPNVNQNAATFWRSAALPTGPTIPPSLTMEL